MKRLFFCSLFITISIAIHAQGLIEYYPTFVFNYPDLHPDSLSKYQRQYKKILRLESMNFEDLSKAEKEFAEQYSYLREGPFFTDDIGCSWYCAADIKKIAATSYLDNNKRYQAANLHDFDSRTPWIENAAGQGIGETIDFDFQISGPLQMTNIKIYNGYCKSLKSWKENSRVKRMAIYINDVKFGYLNLQDSYFQQDFYLGKHGLDQSGKLIVKLEIVSVYPGDKYADTAISEINFDGIGDH